jgi:hypothetical protein
MSRRLTCMRAGWLLVWALSLHSAQVAPAEAQQWSRHHASLCRPAYPADQQWHAVGGPGVTNYPSGFHTVKCELPDTSVGPDSAITRIRIYVRDAANWDYFEARVCRTPRNDLDLEGVCGPSVNSGESFTGETVLTLGATELAPLETTDFGYLVVYIPNRSDAVGWSYLKGFVIER